MSTIAESAGAVNGTPPTASPPPADLVALPRRARAAYVARCARRVQRLLPDLSPVAYDAELAAYDHAIAAAEAAAGGSEIADLAAAADAAESWALHQVPPGLSYPNRTRPLSFDERYRQAVGLAAACAARAAADGDPGVAGQAHGFALRAAWELAKSSVIAGEMARDLAFLKQVAAKEAWSDESAVPPERIPQPHLKLTGLHVRDLRSIRALDWPQVGVGWNGEIPEILTVGGVNGSGKSTLLELISAALDVLGSESAFRFDSGLPRPFQAREVRMDLDIGSRELTPTRIRFLAGDSGFVDADTSANWWAVKRPVGDGGFHTRHGNVIHRIHGQLLPWFKEISLPSVFHMPSDDRRLFVLDERFKSAGNLTPPAEFVYRWRPPTEWKDSLEALLYGLRWEDLNAKEEGRPEDAYHFRSYAEAFHRFTEGRKTLEFRRGELVVALAGGATHPIAELSSGEKQALLLTGELLRRWRPGSLILIDEPELHLHDQWQTRLFTALRYWQHERGGQVIMTTQSDHFYGLAGFGSTALLRVAAP